MLKIILCLATTGATFLDALSWPKTRAALQRLVSNHKPTTFVTAVLSSEPWLALNTLHGDAFVAWEADLRAIVAAPHKYGLKGRLPWRPIPRLRGLGVHATGQSKRVYVLALAWHRSHMPPELLRGVVNYCIRGQQLICRNAV